MLLLAYYYYNKFNFYLHVDVFMNFRRPVDSFYFTARAGILKNCTGNMDLFRESTDDEVAIQDISTIHIDQSWNS